jgi:hypothetical protein
VRDDDESPQPWMKSRHTAKAERATVPKTVVRIQDLGMGTGGAPRAKASTALAEEAEANHQHQEG